MATKCSWCGEKIGLFDADYTYKKVADELHCICGKCSKKVSAAQNGNITFEEIKTDKTVPELFIRLSKQVSPVTEVAEVGEAVQEQPLIDEDIRKTNRMYDDIHQLAKDLRFIKNFLKFCIISSCIAAFIWLLVVLF